MSFNLIGEKGRKLFFEESFSVSEEQSLKHEPPDKGREKVESLGHGNRVCFESNSAIKANMARELLDMGLDAESITRVLHIHANQVAEWIDTAPKGRKADG